MYFYYNVGRNRNMNDNNFSTNTGNPQAGYAWRIWNNTFDLSATGGYDTLFNGPSGTIDFRNNAIIWTCANSDLANVVRSNNAYDNSGTFANTCKPSSETNGIFTADLGFINVTTGTSLSDYHLTSSSPLIGKGVNVGLTTDFDGKLVSGTPSIGAFEFVSNSVILLPPSNLTLAP
jgi:hypothetical protein